MLAWLRSALIFGVSRDRTHSRQIFTQFVFNTVRYYGKKKKKSGLNLLSRDLIPSSKSKPSPKIFVLDTAPYPILKDLPEIPLRVLKEGDSSGNSIFKSDTRACDFIARYTNQNALPGVVEERGASSILEKNIFRVSLRVEVPESLADETFKDVKQVIGVGEASSIKIARRIARLDLAERLYRVLRDGTLLLSEKEKKELDLESTSFIQLDISDDLRDNLQKTCQDLSDTGIFQVQTDHQIEGEGGRDQQMKRSHWENIGSRRDHNRKRPSNRLIENIEPPKREASRLPIWKLYHQLVKTIESNNVTILSAATGSGKTTQLPQFILDTYIAAREHFDRPPSILVTQPRRIAAKTVSQRVSDERDRWRPGSGSSIGYSVRFDSKFPKYSPDGTAIFCTAGILLRRLQKDPLLSDITHLILDEVHERDVFTDLLLLVTKKLLKNRPDLRVILMSATMDADKFVNYFEDDGYNVGRVLDIEGTNHPVKEHYLDDILSITRKNPVTLEDERAQKDFIETELNYDAQSNEGMNGIIIEDNKLQNIPYGVIASLVRHITNNESPGAILIFLPGWEEITELSKVLSSINLGAVEFHLLHSTSPIGSADAAFKRPEAGIRKIILATNIAESSVTIPDVVYVIDSGKQKVMHYDQRYRMNILEPCWISKANRRQRLGRAGRCQPGKYYGIYSEGRSRSFPEQTLPELLRLGLDEVCLNLKAMGLTESSTKLLAKAIDPPERMAIRSALDRLRRLGAINDNEDLTPLGRILANIPISPTMGKMLITAYIFGCLGPILTAVGLIGQKIFRPARLPEEKFTLHNFYGRFGKDIWSDHLLAHEIWQKYQQNGFTIPYEYSGFEHLLSRVSLRKLDDSRFQILKELRNVLNLNNEEAEINSKNDGLVRLMLTSGFYPDIAIAKDKRNTYNLQRLTRVLLSGSSMNHVLGSTTIAEATKKPLLRTGLRRKAIITANRDERPQFLIYEDLIDIGQKLIAQTTAVDPLFFFLFAGTAKPEDVKKTSSSNSNNSDNIMKQLTLDGWITYRSENPKDLELLNELRFHWNDFVQFIIDKHIRGVSLTEVEKKYVDRFKSLILELANECTLTRKILKDNNSKLKRDSDSSPRFNCDPDFSRGGQIRNLSRIEEI